MAELQSSKLTVRVRFPSAARTAPAALCRDQLLAVKRMIGAHRHTHHDRLSPPDARWNPTAARMIDSVTQVRQGAVHSIDADPRLSTIDTPHGRRGS
jgi:hypothetical protein